MKEVQLTQLSLVNFKGIRHLDINFQGKDTKIAGENGTGKTTIFDAFLWLLFGKDSTNRSDSNFNIKTLNSSGKPILKLEHSVTGVLSVNGKMIKLQRCFKEKWVKPRGTTEETLQNHQTDFYINDVLLSTKKEYDAEVNDICPEDVFRMITNPFFFPLLPAATQKTMLLDMAGSVSDEEVAANTEDYLNLLKELNGTSLERFTKEVTAKKRAIKDELLIIPSNIQTAQRLMPEAEDWKALEQELDNKKQKVARIDAQLSDLSKAAEAESERKVAIQRLIGEKKQKIQSREYEIRSEASKAGYEAARRIQEIENTISSVSNQISQQTQLAQTIANRISSKQQELDTLRAEYRSLNSETLIYPQGAFICPTCKRPLESEDVEAKQAEMMENFLQTKSAKLSANREAGKAKKSELEKLTEQAKSAITELESLKEKLNSLQAYSEEEKKALPNAPDFNKIVVEDTMIVTLKNEITDLENQLTMEPKQNDNSELISGKEMLNDGIQELIKALSKRDQIDRAQKEIANLEDKQINANQKLADLEKLEYISLQFQKAKDEALMQKINGLFSIVSFSFVDTQLNGGEKLTCMCYADGVPFPDLNNARKINAGLDIINAICRSKGITAPIFIDNRESVNELIPTLSQIINLCVTTDQSLVMETANGNILLQ